MTFDRDKYARDYNRASTANPMTASCPPADEAASIRDSAIEEIGDDIQRDAIADPLFMAELILESDYDSTILLEMTKSLCAMMEKTNQETILDFGYQMVEFIEMRVEALAEEQIDL